MHDVGKRERYERAIMQRSKQLRGARCEKQIAQVLVDAGLNLLEGLLIDINKLATAAEHLAYHK